MRKLLSKIRRIARLESGSLKRVLGVSDLFAVGFADLGSSIYYALGVTALFALGATPVALGLAGLIFVCTALTYAELSSTFHEAGGTASFARRAFNDLISFIAGWGLLFDYIVTISISAFAVAPYLSFFFPAFKEDIFVHIGFTAALIAILYLVNFFGVRQSTRMSFFLVTAAIVTQIVVIFIGFYFLFKPGFIWQHIHIGLPEEWSPSWTEFWKGTAMAMVAYTGIESIAQLGAETRKPAKIVPKAILVTMGVLLLLYVGISVTALSAIPPKVLGTAYVDDPIAGIVAYLPFGNDLLGAWVGIFAGILLFSASNSGLIGASRLAFNMGENYQLPRFFFRLHKEHKTPYVALLFFAFLSIVIVCASRGKMDFLADLYNFGAMLAFFFAHLSLLVLRIKKPHLERPFRAPLNIPFGKYSLPLPALVGCLATASVWVLVVVTKPEGRNFGFTWMILGVLLYLYYRKKQKIAPTAHVDIKKVHIPDFQPMHLKNILLSLHSTCEMEAIQMACALAKTHRARLTALTVLEIPASMPLQAKLLQRELLGEAILKRAEAIGRELDIPVELRMLRARSAEGAILEILEHEDFDLLIVGRVKEEKMLNQKLERLLREAPCRTLLCQCASAQRIDFA